MKYRIRVYNEYNGVVTSDRIEESEMGADEFYCKVCADEYDGEDIDTTKYVKINFKDYDGREEELRISGYPVNIIGY